MRRDDFDGGRRKFGTKHSERMKLLNVRDQVETISCSCDLHLHKEQKVRATTHSSNQINTSLTTAAIV